MDFETFCLWWSSNLGLKKVIRKLISSFDNGVGIMVFCLT